VNSIVDNRNVILKILEMDTTEADIIVNQAQELVNDFKEKGFHTGGTDKLLQQIKQLREEEQLSTLSDLAHQIAQKHEQATNTHTKYTELQQKINEANNKYLETTQTERAMNLVLAAFERGDYATALSRIDEAELIFASEIKGEIPYRWYWESNKTIIITTIILLAVLATISTYFSRKAYFTYKINSCKKEENILLGLIKEFQYETFTKKIRSLAEYHNALEQYEAKLAAVISKQNTYENKKRYLFTFTPHHKKLLKEKEDITKRIQELQERYMQEGLIESRMYENRMRELTTRAAEIDEALATEEANKALKKVK